MGLAGDRRPLCPSCQVWEDEGLSGPCSHDHQLGGPAPQHPFLGQLCSTLQKGVRPNEKGAGQCFVLGSRDDGSPAPRETPTNSETQGH